MAVPEKLSLRAKLTYGVHLFKALTRQHHREMLPLLQPLLEKESVIIDVGAHAGQFSKLFSRLAPYGRIYAFEPAGYARSILETVVRAHSLKNIVILPWGLGDKSSCQTLHIPFKASGSLGFGLSHLGGGENVDDRPTYQEDIKIIRLDDFVEEHNLSRLDLVKADIEGWEMRLLAGAENTIAKFGPVLLLEIDENFLQRAGDTPDDVWDFLKRYDYEILRLDFTTSHSLMTIPAPEPCSGDILCLPKKV